MLLEISEYSPTAFGDTFHQEHIFTLKNSRPARIRQVKNINYRAFH